jgi:prepilin-type N-terminal cleavage/methylation domain-containing protein/prepilin-type processing-associated H-X9-DG protein
MTRSRFFPARKPREGFTLIELLVVISIIAVLASLIAPAVQSARRAARKAQCMSNMRQVGIAMQNFSSTNNGNLPSLWTTQTVTNSSSQQGAMYMSWCMQLLPALDNSALLKNIKNDSLQSGVNMVINTNPGFENVAIEVFTCPDHVAAYKKAGGLSYVVNAGHQLPGAVSGAWGVSDANHYPGDIDWALPSGAGDANDIAVGQATGVIWRSGYTSSLEYVSTGDGTTTTVLLSENLQAGRWYDVNTNAIGFGIRMPSTLTNAYVNAGAGGSSQLYITAAASPDDWFINRNLSATQFTAPRPSSQHANGVNVIMCDGSAKFLNESIDQVVYTKIMTSNGVAYGEQALDAASF